MRVLGSFDAIVRETGIDVSFLWHAPQCVAQYEIGRCLKSGVKLSSAGITCLEEPQYKNASNVLSTEIAIDCHSLESDPNRRAKLPPDVPVVQTSMLVLGAFPLLVSLFDSFSTESGLFDQGNGIKSTSESSFPFLSVSGSPRAQFRNLFDVEPVANPKFLDLRRFKTANVEIFSSFQPPPPAFLPVYSPRVCHS